MVPSATLTASSCALPQNAAQSHADPPVQGSKRGPVTVLEVIEPTTQGLVQAGDHEGQRVTGVPMRFDTHRLLELCDAFLPRPVEFVLEVIAQKIKAFISDVYNLGFLGMQRQPVLRHPLPYRFQGTLGLFRRA